MSEPRLLCVDDNESNAELVRRVARRLDPTLRVEHVVDGDKALLHLARVARSRTSPLLVLLDLHMPRMGGHSCLREIRANLIWDALPVAILTSSTQCSDRNAALRAGATDYLVKPLTLEALTRLLGGGISARPGAGVGQGL